MAANMKRRTGWVYGVYGVVVVAILACSYTCSKRRAVHSVQTALPPLAESGLNPEVIETLQAILTAWDSFQTVSADIVIKLSSAAGLPGHTKGKGQYDLEKRDGHSRIRFRNKTVVMAEEGTVKGKYYGATEALYWITDGEVLYHSSRHVEFHRVTKSWYDPANILQIGGPAALDALRRDYELRMLPNEDLEGEPVFVIEATPRGGDWVSLHYFDKARGLRRKWIEKDSAGETTFEVTLSKPQFDIPFGEDHFTFEVPEEAEFVDKTVDTP